MGLKVVGTGLGRTGTKSMQTALAMLGFGPCHHMVEVIHHPESMQLWIDVGEGRPDWDAIFKDYNSAVDYPSAAYWRELKRQRERALWTGAICLLGGAGGAWLLLRSGDKTFLLAVPASVMSGRTSDLAR